MPVVCQAIDKSIREDNILENSKDIPLRLTKKRKLAEILIDKKNRLAVGVYDLLDKHIRLIDDELNALDEAINDCNGKPDIRGKNEIKSNSVSFESDDTKSKSVSFVNEPVYCNCHRVAFGEMIACDNEECLIEWFHFPCVNLTKLPRKLWYCPDCSLHIKK